MSEMNGERHGITPTLVRYLVLGALCGSATVAYLCRQGIGVAESTIRTELQLSEHQMSWVMGSFFLVYGLGQLPGGWLARRWGSRITISLCAIIWSLATIIIGFAHGISLLLVGRLASGLGQAGLFPSTTASIGKWFPDTRRAIANGSMSSFMSLGGMISLALTGELVPRIGWRLTFASYGLIGLIFAAMFYLWFRNTPAEHRWVNDREQALIESRTHAIPKPTPLAHGNREHNAWLAICCVPTTWLICGQQFCRAAGEIFFSSWFPTFLQETRDVSVQQSGWLSSLPVLGIVVGAFVGGSLSDWILSRTGNYKLARSGVASVAMIACAIHIGIAYFVTDAVVAVSIIAFGAFCAALGSPCAYTVTIDVGGEHTPLLFATMNMVGNLGAFAFIRVVPMLTPWFGWSGVLGLFALLYVVAALCWLSIDPRRHILGPA